MKKLYLIITLMCFVFAGAQAQTHCSPSGGAALNNGDFFFGPTNVTYGTINHNSPASVDDALKYSDFSNLSSGSGSGNIYGYSATVLSVSLISTYKQKLRAYIDWNNDGVFDEATETVLGASVGNAINPQQTPIVSINVTPPLNAVKGIPLRLRVIADFEARIIAPCKTPQDGQVEDYAVTVEDFTGGCSGISSEISVVTSSVKGIAGTQFDVYANGVIGTAGIQYQWQKSATAAGPWLNIPSANTNFTTITAAGYNASFTFYRLKVTCDDTQIASFSDVVSYEILPNYCAARGSDNGSGGLTKVTFASINNSSSYENKYENFTSVSTDVQVGNTYTFYASLMNAAFGDQVTVWIDYNYDGDFTDAGEKVLDITYASSQPIFSYPITISANASLGKKRMRIRHERIQNGTVATSLPCGTTSNGGEVEDYTVNLTDIGCAGISENISASISATTGITGDTYSLSAAGITGAYGIEYQWQKSATGTSSWVNVANATTKTTNQTAAGDNGSMIYYRMKVTCVATQVDYFSTVVSFKITLNYCSAGATDPQGEKIRNIYFAGINNESDSTNGYEDFTSIIGVGIAGNYHELRCFSNYETTSINQVNAWIDYNNDGDFDDAGEHIMGESGNSPYVTSTKIPLNAATGKRRLRIRMDNIVDAGNGTPCGNSIRGQVEDYTIMIISRQTTWTGTGWNNWFPDENVNAIITGPLTLTGNVLAKNLTVAPTGSITIPAGMTLTVVGSITNQGVAGNFIVENGGNLIQQSDALNTGAITVKRNSTSMVRNDNTMWSSPVTGQSLRNFSTETLYNRFWSYNEGTNFFSSIFSNNEADSNFADGLGYSVRVRNTLVQGESTIHQGIFIGTPINGVLNVRVSNTGAATEDKGYNSIGNPYPSPIKADGSNGFLAKNPNVEALYFWTHQYPILPQGGYAGSNYASYTALNIDQLGSIGVGQGFIVKATSSGKVLFNNAMRSATTSTAFRTGTSSSIEKHRVTLKLSNETEVLSKTLIGYMTGATNDFDTQIDGKLIDHTSTALYNIINNEKYAVQGRALPFETSDVVSLGFKLTQLGQYTIAIESKDGLFAEGQAVYLKDNQLNSIHNLSESAYTFDAVAGEFNNRFEVQYVNATLGAGNFKSSNVLIYQIDQNIVVNSPDENLKSVMLHDILGRTLYQKNGLNDTNLKISTTSFGNQVLILQVETVSGKVVTKKIINKQ